MADDPGDGLSFFAELKRRRVVRIAIVYAVVAFTVWQVAEIAFPALGIPGWAMSVVVVLSIVGFPVALVLTWAFDITPEGIRRTSEDAPIADPAGATTARTRLRWAIGGGALVVFVIGAAYLVRVIPDGVLGPNVGPIRSLAVLPFENLSGDPDQDYVSAGMTDILTTTLGTLASLRVISRQSTMEFRGSSEAPTQIASQLGVDGLISGSVLRVDDDVRIIAQLADARSGEQVWTASYDGSAGEIFALQGETARTIADQIQLALTPDEELRLASAESISPEAWELYFRGRHHLEDSNESGLSLAIESFSGAIEVDPEFAAAHASLGYAYALAIQYGYLPSGQYAPRIRAEAEEAIRLDPTLAEAHLSVANLDYRGGRDWEGLEERYLRGIEMNPNSADAWHYYSHFLMSTLRVDEAVEAALRGVEVDPLTRVPRVHLGLSYYHARRYDESIAVGLQTLERFPDYTRMRLSTGNAYLRKGQFADALEHFAAAVAVSREWDNLGALAIGHARAGNIAEARQLLDELLATDAPPFRIGRVYGSLGEMDAAFEWMERAVDINQGNLANLLISPSFDPFRAEPIRWRALLVRAGFSEELIEQAMARS